MLRFLEVGCARDVTLASKVVLLARNRVMGGVVRKTLDRVTVGSQGRFQHKS